MGLLGGQKRVLMIGSEGIVLFGPGSGGAVDHELAIAWDVPNFDKQLTDALSHHNTGSPVLILFDSADQTYRKEDNIPKLGRMDRGRYVKRKLDQAFPSYPIRASFEVAASRPAPGAPMTPSSFLFVAIPETEKLDRVSKCIMDAGVPVSGFGLLPLESSGLVAALSEALFAKKGPRKSRWAVLVSQHEGGGLRQVVVKDGKLALTRMTPPTEGGVAGQGWVEEVMHEFKATLTYVARFGYTPADGLDVMVICGAREKEIFAQQQDLPGTNFTTLNVAQALAAIGLKAGVLGETNFGDAIHAGWGMKKRGMTVPIAVPSITRVQMPRLGAKVASVGLIVTAMALLGLSIMTYGDYGSTRSTIEEKTAEKTRLERDYTQQSKVFDALPVKPDMVKATLSVQKTLDQNSVSITPTLNVLRKVLDKDIKLVNFSYEHTPAGTKKPSLLKLGGAAEDPRGSVKISFRFGLTTRLPLEQKIQRAEILTETLRQAFKGYDVRIATQFGNMSRTGSFTGVVGGEDAQNQKSDEEAVIEMEGAPL